MEYILSSPFIVKVILSLAFILIVNRVTDRLYLAVACGTILLGVLSGHGADAMTALALDKALSPNTLFLMVIIFQVIWLSSQMSETGVMKDLVTSVNRGLSKRTSMAVLPAVIGLLPMPGGALFSAPLVDECDTENGVEPLQKTLINYWFRHIWEYWWPLYPGVLLALDLTGMSILDFMLIQFPLSLVSVSAGYIFILRKVEYVKKDKSAGYGAVAEILKHLTPVTIIIITYALINIFIPVLAEFNKYIPMIAGIIFAQLYLQLGRPLPFRIWMSIIFSVKTLKLAILVLLILIYGAFISAPLPDSTLIMDHMKNELSSWGIPLFFVVMLIPFISGLTTGIAVGFVGASFPIVVSLAGGDISYLVLAYGCGYMGMMLSPVHVCLVVTAEHFNTDVSRTIKSLFFPAVSVMTGIILIHFLYRLIF
jgi:hypothetical protein